MLRQLGALAASIARAAPAPAGRTAAAQAERSLPALTRYFTTAPSAPARESEGASSSAAAAASLAGPATRRPGVLAVKAGMTHEWDEWGVHVPLTVLWVDECQVTQLKRTSTDGYDAVQVGSGFKRPKALRATELGHFAVAGTPPKRSVAEFRVSQDALDLLELGSEIRAGYFVPGQTVDVQGRTAGKGFQGGMRRWGFSGGNASHGSSLFHRGLGSTGANQDPGKVWKGKKMPGHMGDRVRTVQNVRVHKVDADRNLIYLVGQIPGKRGEVVRVSDAVKGSFQNQPARPLAPGAADVQGVQVAQAPQNDPYAWKDE